MLALSCAPETNHSWYDCVVETHAVPAFLLQLLWSNLVYPRFEIHGQPFTLSHALNFILFWLATMRGNRYACSTFPRSGEWTGATQSAVNPLRNNDFLATLHNNKVPRIRQTVTSRMLVSADDRHSDYILSEFVANVFKTRGCLSIIN